MKGFSEKQRFEAVCAAAEVEAMRRRWRKRLYEALPPGFDFANPLTFKHDGFSWDDGFPLESHPYRLRAVREALRPEVRAAESNLDGPEVLPDKVLLCKDPEIMRLLECWDLPLPPPAAAER